MSTMLSSVQNFFGTSGSSGSSVEDEDSTKQQEENNTTKQLQQLKDRLRYTFKIDPSQSHSDRSLLRFLKATGSVEAAYSDVIRYNTWRKEQEIDELSPNDPDVLEYLSMGFVHSLRIRDNDGRPVLYVIARKHQASTRDLEKLTKFIVYMLEITLKRMDERVNDTLCLVFDLYNFSMSNMDYAFVKRLVWLLTRFYPERLGVCLVYSAPVVFQGCWPVIKRWLHEATASKVIFVKDREAMAKYLEVDALPPQDM